jgi:nitrite reductase (NADH) large subunit
MTEKLVIIGNGMAPGRMLEKLFETDPGRYERHHFQRRAARQLRPHHAVAGAVGREELRGHRHPRRRLVHRKRIMLYKGQDRRDRPRRQDRASGQGITRAYDKLVIATGSVPFIIPVPGTTCRACSPTATSMTSTP